MIYTLESNGELLNRGVGMVLTNVPEPSAWAMMLLGFAGLGYAAIRRNGKARRTAPLGEAAV